MAQRSARHSKELGLISRRFSIWLWRLSRRGVVDANDLPRLPSDFEAQHLVQKAVKICDAYDAKGEPPSLWYVMWHVNRSSLLISMFVSVAHGILATGVRPLLLREVIKTVEDLQLRDVLLLTVALILEACCQMWMKQLISDEPSSKAGAILAGLVSRRIPFRAEIIQPKAQTADAAKVTVGNPVGGSIVSSKGSERDAPIAEINLIGNDVLRTIENARPIFQFWSCVIQFVCATMFLLYVVGPIACIGLGICCFSVFVVGILTKLNKANDKGGLRMADARVGLLKQILDGIRFIKLSAWEASYAGELKKMREGETMHHRRYRTIEMMTITIGRMTPPLASMTTFIAMALLEEDLNPADVFSTLSVFLTLRLPLSVLPMCVQQLISVGVSLKRIGRELSRPTVKPLPPPKDTKLVVSMSNVNFSWIVDAPLALRDVNLDVRKGELVAIIGAVASGKTTLLSGLLGGLPAHRGLIERCPNSVGYIPQRAIVFSGTILENVCMGHAMDEAKLQQALHVAQFTRDLEMMPKGLQTEIGERGTTLSGGQQARLNIARAIYHDPEFLVADDPLAAVDVHVGKQIFSSLSEWQKAGQQVGTETTPRTMVMSLNQLHFLHDFDYVVYLEAGSIVVQGPAEDVYAEAAKWPELHELLESSRVALTCDTFESVAPVSDIVLSPDIVSIDIFDGEEQQASSKTALPASNVPLASLTDGKFVKEVQPVEPIAVSKDTKLVKEQQTSIEPTTASKDNKLVKEEHRETGAIRNNIPLQYLRAVGGLRSSAYFALIFLSYVFLAANDWWLTVWMGDSPDNDDDGARLQNASIYAGLAIFHCIFMIMTNFAGAFAGAHASRHLHKLCAENILRAPMSWFEETPSGRTISKFSADMNIVDLRLPTSVDHTVQLIAATLVNIVGMCVVVPWMAIFVFIVIPIYVRLDFFINKSAREVKRICNNALSPVLTLIQEASEARVLLRVMGQESWLHEKLVDSVDKYDMAYFTSVSLLTFQRFFANAIGVGASLLVASLFWAVPSLVKNAPGGASAVGLALTYSFLVPYFLSYVSMFFSLARVFLTSLERLLELTSERVPQECPWSKADDPPTSWPAQGAIEFRNVTLRYRPTLPPAVRSLDLTIGPGERLGVVGRTGAGKSSLSVLLLRIVEPEAGAILVDGIDVTNIGLHTLRRAIAVVPQDAFLFQGTIRRNLDPLGQYSLNDLTSALSYVGLHLDLESDVGKGGGQLSSGQRQLVAMARATLSNTKIVVMDEPTANCDAQTDAKLQELLSESFTGRTVVCIAHRLNTIMGYDKILVMDKGAALEHGSPNDLLADSTTLFSQMAAGMQVLRKDAGKHLKDA